MLEIHTFIAELPAHSEHLLHAADDQPLEVQLGGDPQVEIKIVGVDMGLEGPGIRAAMDQLQNWGLDLCKAAGVE